MEEVKLNTLYECLSSQCSVQTSLDCKEVGLIVCRM